VISYVWVINAFSNVKKKYNTESNRISIKANENVTVNLRFVTVL
jgi:hypothetical protein